MTVFFPKSSSAKGDYFCVSLLYSEDNRQGRSPMVSPFIVLVLRSNFDVFQSRRCFPTSEQPGVITALYLVTLYIDILGPVDKSIYLLLF